jgi:tetratricopeptide (TPR) repeat protein
MIESLPMTRRGRAFAALALALAALALAATEARLRRKLGPPPADAKVWQDEVRYLNSEIDLPFFVKTGTGPDAVWTSNRPMAIPQTFPDRLGARDLRVFVVGESVAYRLGTEALVKPLSAAFPGRDVRVINAGMGGYDVYRAALIQRELLALSPQLFVVLVGNNQNFAPRRLIGVERVWYTGYRLNLFLRRSWIWTSLQDWVESRSPAPGPEVGLKRFELGLRDILRRARERSVPVVVCTLAANVRDCPPHGELPLNEREFFLAWSAQEEGRAAEALLQLQAFTKRLPGDPMGHYYLAKLLFAAGRWEDARREFIAALDGDYPDRCSPAKNAVIRRLAAEEGAALADLEGLFTAVAPHGLPGWESFVDNVHWSHRFDGAAARVIAAAAAKRPDPGAERAARAALSDDSAADEPFVARAAAEAVQAGRLRPPMLSERAVAEFVLALRRDRAGVTTLLERPAELRDMLAGNEWLRSLSDGPPEQWSGVLIHVGEAEARLGRRAAAVALLRRAAQAPGPDAPLARRLLSRQYALSGDRAGALRELALIPPDSRERVLADEYLSYYRAARP